MLQNKKWGLQKFVIATEFQLIVNSVAIISLYLVHNYALTFSEGNFSQRRLFIMVIGAMMNNSYDVCISINDK